MPKGIPKVKKGNKSWQPAALLQIHDKRPGFRYRWEKNEPAQIMKSKAEGFEVCSDLTDKVIHDEELRVDDGHKLTSVQEYREMILLRIPEETAQARQEYFSEMSAKQVRGLKQEVDGEVRNAGGAPVTGSIIID